jgi:hypothetical protein
MVLWDEQLSCAVLEFVSVFHLVGCLFDWA